MTPRAKRWASTRGGCRQTRQPPSRRNRTGSLPRACRAWASCSSGKETTPRRLNSTAKSTAFSLPKMWRRALAPLPEELAQLERWQHSVDQVLSWQARSLRTCKPWATPANATYEHAAMDLNLHWHVGTADPLKWGRTPEGK
eukprot:787925-Rhodomonas_salina.2